MTSLAVATAVSKPKVLSTNAMSLSMVLGMPTTAIRSDLRATSSWRACAARIVPSPPIRNKMSTRWSTRPPTSADASRVPRDVPRNVPAWMWRSRTSAGSRTIGPSGSSATRPPSPKRKPRILSTPYACRSSRTMARMTSLMPGQIPPAVRMPTVTRFGSKKMFSRGPASSKARGPLATARRGSSISRSTRASSGVNAGASSVPDGARRSGERMVRSPSVRTLWSCLMRIVSTARTRAGARQGRRGGRARSRPPTPFRSRVRSRRRRRADACRARRGGVLRPRHLRRPGPP